MRWRDAEAGAQRDVAQGARTASGAQAGDVAQGARTASGAHAGLVGQDLPTQRYRTVTSKQTHVALRAWGETLRQAHAGSMCQDPQTSVTEP